MPKIGELRKGKDLGFVSSNYKIWAACVLCGKERWTCFVRGEVEHPRCNRCSKIGRIQRKFSDSEKKQRRQLWGRRHRDKQKSVVFQHYSNLKKPCCKMCEIDDIDVLTIDHINNDGHKHRELVGVKMYRWLVQNNFPEGFQVLCANCNLKKEIVRKRNANSN